MNLHFRRMAPKSTPVSQFIGFLLLLGLGLFHSGCGRVSGTTSNIQNTPLTVAVTSPAPGASVSGTIKVLTSASSNASSVQLLVDGKSVGSAVTSAPFSFSLDTTMLSNGTHSLSVTASDTAGQTAASAPVSISVNNSTPPTISISSPANGAVVSGPLTIVATVSSNTTSVQFVVDGKNSGAAVSAAPFSYTFNSTTLTNGTHTLSGVAANSAGQTTSSAVVSITVNNPQLQITTSTLPNGQVGAAYSVTLQASGGTAPLMWSISSGQLPAGLALSTAGVISGTPTASGTVKLTIGVSDASGSSASATLTITIAAATAAVAPFGHVFIVMEENTNYADVIGSASAPYLNALANQYGLATQYYASSHPSIPNYFALTTGQTLTNDDSQTPLTFPVSVDNVVRELLAAGKTWKSYAESIPSLGYIGGDATGPDGGTFYTRHVPLPFMTDVQDSATQKLNIVPFTQLAADLAANDLPDYSFITPNGCDDAHDCSLSVADTWLKNKIDPLIKSAAFQKDGLLLIVFDESGNDNTNGGGRVAAVIVSPFCKSGYKSTTLYQHPSVLRLMLEGLGVKTVPAPASAAPKMWEFFTFTPPT